MHPRRLALFTLILLASATIALAGDGNAPVAEVPDAAVPGLQVAIDPVTGKLRLPTPEEARILAEGLRGALNDSSEGLEAVPLPGGGEAVDLDGRFQNVLVAVTHLEGDLVHQCLSSPVQIDWIVPASTDAGRAQE